MAARGQEIHLDADFFLLLSGILSFFCVRLGRLIFWRLCLFQMSLNKTIHKALLLPFFNQARLYTLLEHPPHCACRITCVCENGVDDLSSVKAKRAESA